MMPEVHIRKVLYATDLSESARYAFAYAINIAHQYQAELAILHVVEEHMGMDEKIIGYVSEKRWQELKQRNEDEARAVLIGKQRGAAVYSEALDNFCADSQQQIGPVARAIVQETVLAHGEPVSRIIETAENKNCDIIVLGTHGHGRLADAVLGNTARRVIRRAKCPVLTVRLPDED